MTSACAVLALAPGLAACGGDDDAVAPPPPAPTATDGAGAEATALRDTAGRVRTEVRSDVERLIDSGSVEVFGDRAGDLGRTVADGARRIRAVDAPPELAAERDRVAGLLDGLRGEVAEARGRAAEGDLNGALGTLAASSYRETDAALERIAQAG